GIRVVGVGKIAQLFAGRGISDSHPTKSNRDGMKKTLELLEKKYDDSRILILVNLIEFDQNFGHRKDAPGFRAALEDFDRFLPGLLDLITRDDLLIITADHGCDPTTPGTDHTREHVPLIAYRPALESPQNLGRRPAFADAGATAAEFLGIPKPPAGTGFLENLAVKNENSF
ncbi:MAG: phosphopentomutase, partial [bacterium]